MKVARLSFNFFWEFRCHGNCDIVGCVEGDVCKEAIQPVDLVIPQPTNAHHRENIEVFAVLPIDNILIPFVLSSIADVV